MQKPKKRQGISKKKKLEDLYYHFKAIDIKVDWYWGKQRPIELKRNQIIHCLISKGTIAIYLVRAQGLSVDQISSLQYAVFRASQVALVVKNPPANAGDLRGVSSIPGSGRFTEGGHGNPLQYSCLENPQGLSLVSYHSQGRKESDTNEQTWHR